MTERLTDKLTKFLSLNEINEINENPIHPRTIRDIMFFGGLIVLGTVSAIYSWEISNFNLKDISNLIRDGYELASNAPWKALYW